MQELTKSAEGPVQIPGKTDPNLWLDLVCFVATVVFAWWYRWEVRDLAWSLWISSLTLGYLYLLTGIAGILFGPPGQIPGVSGINASAYARQRLQWNERRSREVSGKVTPGYTGRSIPQNDRRQPYLSKENPPPIPENKSQLSSGSAGGIFGAMASLVFVAMLFMIFGMHRITLYGLVAAIVCTTVSLIPVLREKTGMKFLPDLHPRLVHIFGAMPLAAFLFGFFTFHFLGFHFGHSMILNMVLPISHSFYPGEDLEAFPGFFKDNLLIAFSRYWFFILMSVPSRLSVYSKAFRTNDMSVMFLPYKNVVRMHVMIILFAILDAAGLKGVMLYLLLALYFFPFNSISGGLFKRKHRFG